MESTPPTPANSAIEYRKSATRTTIPATEITLAYWGLAASQMPES